MWSEVPPTRRLGVRWRVAGATLLTALTLGVPTDVIDTPVFTRLVPVRWWEYVTVVAASVLVGAWATRSRPLGRGGVSMMLVGLVSIALSLGCPHCNRAVVWLIGLDRTLTWWAGAQPVLAVLGCALAVVALLRDRNR